MALGQLPKDEKSTDNCDGGKHGCQRGQDQLPMRLENPRTHQRDPVQGDLKREHSQE